MEQYSDHGQFTVSGIEEAFDLRNLLPSTALDLNILLIKHRILYFYILCLLEDFYDFYDFYDFHDLMNFRNLIPMTWHDLACPVRTCFSVKCFLRHFFSLSFCLSLSPKVPVLLQIYWRLRFHFKIPGIIFFYLNRMS